jgi:hypothetical protein
MSCRSILDLLQLRHPYETGISAGISDIRGQYGVSPIASGAMTGFTLTLDSSESFRLLSHGEKPLESVRHTHRYLAQAVSDMQAAYMSTSRSLTPCIEEEYQAATIGGETFYPGVFFGREASPSPRTLQRRGGRRRLHPPESGTSTPRPLERTRVWCAGD